MEFLLPRRWRILLLAAALLLAATTDATAGDATVLAHLPEDAYGFVLVRRLAETTERLDSVLQTAGFPLPPALGILRTLSGLGPGVDDRGDVLAGLLPASGRGDDAAGYAPLLLAPLRDYEAFAAHLHADPSGEISRVTVAGEDVLVARLAGFALLMNVEHEPLMTRLLQAPAVMPPVVEPLREALEHNHFSLVLLPAGIRRASDLGRASLQDQAQSADEQFAVLPDNSLWEQVRQLLGWSRAAIDFADARVETFAVGLHVDAETNLSCSGQIALVDPLAATPAADAGASSGPATFRDVPFAAVAGGPLPRECGAALAALSRRLAAQNPDAYGLAGLEEQDWKQYEASYAAALEGVRGAALIALPGGADEAVYSNLYGLLEVEDADRYLAAYRRSMELWNDLLRRSTSPAKVVYELRDVQVAGRTALLAQGNVGAAADDPNVPFMQDFMEAMFGEGGFFRIYLVKLSPQQVWLAIGDSTQAEQRLALIAAEEPSLPASDVNRPAWDLLDGQAAWKGLVSPRGCVAWFRRLLTALLANAAVPLPPIPEFPDTPPLGLSGAVSGRVFRWEAMLPRPTLAAAAEFARGLP